MLLNKRPAVDDDLFSQHISKSIIPPAARSRSTSARNSPAPPVSPKSEASIVLIGIRGTGKSSLAVIASSALGYRVIDADQHFYKATGLSRAAFNAKYGVQEYKRCELRIMRTVLLENQARCVITCGPGSVEGQGRGLLEEYAKTHPVIYILRDLDDIQRHLRAWDKKTISDLIVLTAPAYRASSSFEFYNISESRSPSDHEPVPAHPTLTLKNLQADFLRLVYHVTQQTPSHSRHGSGYEAGHIISSLAPELKRFTYALTLSLSVLPSVVSQLPELESTADAVRFVVDMPTQKSDGSAPFDGPMANHISKYMYLVRRYTQVPMIYEIKSPFSVKSALPRDFRSVEQTYFDLLRFGLRFSPEYICVDIRCNTGLIADLFAAKGSTKIIGSFFDHSPGADSWSSQARERMLWQAEEMGFDIIWMSQEATSSLDNVSVRRFAHQQKSPIDSEKNLPSLAAFNTGRLGRISCWQNETFTPVTHSRLRQPDPASELLLTIPEAQNALYSSFTLDKLFFGVLGSKVSNSVAPLLHNAAYRYCGMRHEYRVFEHTSLTEMKDVFSDYSFGGASITSPFKREIIAIVDSMSPEAEAIGAVNTLLPLRGSKKTLLEALLERNQGGPITGFYGECTDWIAIHNCVSRSLSPVNTVQPSTTAVVLGAGGMARAAVYALLRLGVRNIFVCNRTVRKAQEVADHFSNLELDDSLLSHSSPANSRHPSPRKDRSHSQQAMALHSRQSPQKLNIAVIRSLQDPWPKDTDFPTIIVSTLPGCNADDKVTIDNRVPHRWLASSNGGVVAELAYIPLETPLLLQARAEKHRGWIVVDGLQINLEQAAPQFELFTGRRAPKRQMRLELLRGYKENEADHA